MDEFSQIDKVATRNEFIGYMQRSTLPINGIALFDENDKLTIIENRQHIRTGEQQDFSKAEFIKWARNPDNKLKVFLGGPYIGTAGASTGEIIYVAAKPMYFGTKYKGTITIRILVDDIRKAFIAPLAVDSEQDSFIMSSKGVVIAGRSSLLNKNLTSYAMSMKWKNYKDFTRKLEAIKDNINYVTTWTFQNPNESPKEVLVGVSKIDVPNTPSDLYMVVTTSKDSIIKSLRPLQGYGVLWLGFGILVTIVGSLIVILLPSE